MASPRRSRVAIDLMPMLSPSSKGKRQLQLQAVQIGLAAADGVVQLGLESDVIVQIITSAERRAEAQADIVVDRVVETRVHVLKMDKWTKVTNLFGKLGVERGRVENGRVEM